jgi:hypothetical protein
MDINDLFFEASKPITFFPDKLIGEFIDTIKKELKADTKAPKEKAIVQVPFYEPQTNYGWEYEEEDERLTKYYTLLPYRDFIAISKLLKESNLCEHEDQILSIIRTWYCRNLLYQLNSRYVAENRMFNEEFLNFYEFLAENILEIKLSTKKDITTQKGIITKKIGTSIKSKALINLIRQSFVESVLKLPAAAEHIYLLEDHDLFSTGISENIRQGAALNLLLYIQAKTNFKYNATEENSTKFKFPNRQLELIYKLLSAGRILQDEVFDGTAKDYIRNYINRSKDKSPELVKLFSYPQKQLSDKPRTAPKVITDAKTLKFIEHQSIKHDKRLNRVKSQIERLSNMD